MNRIKPNSLLLIIVISVFFFLLPSYTEAETITLWPSGAGSETSLNYTHPSADHWENVNTEDDGSFVGNNAYTGYLRDLYALQNPTGAPRRGTINKVTANIRIKPGICYGTEKSKISIRTYDIIYESSEETLSLCNLQNYSLNWNVNPATGMAWTWTEIDNLQSGVSLKNMQSDAAILCTQVFVGVDYTPSSVLVPPFVSTNSATNIQAIEATLNGNLSDLGGVDSCDVWFEWGLTTSYGNITSSQSKTAEGPFNATITGLSPQTTYRFRAVAESSQGVSYGDNVSFTTSQLVPADFPPTVITETADVNLQNNRATLRGSITNTGGGNCDQRGFEWGTNTGSYPNGWTETGNYGISSFTHTISGLNPGTIYYYRAKVHNAAGWGYGVEGQFVIYTASGGQKQFTTLLGDITQPTTKIKIIRTSTGEDVTAAGIWLRADNYTIEFEDSDEAGGSGLKSCEYYINSCDMGGTNCTTPVVSLTARDHNWSFDITAGKTAPIYNLEGAGRYYIYSGATDNADNSGIDYKYLNFDFTPPETRIE